MDKAEPTAPLSPHERAAAARALEAVAERLDSPALASLDVADVYTLLGYLRAHCRRVALDLRQGSRARAIDRATADWDGYLARLLDEAAERS